MIVVRIETTGAAFDDGHPGAAGYEVARLLRGLADQLQHLDAAEDIQETRIIDRNGNTVGDYANVPDAELMVAREELETIADAATDRGSIVNGLRKIEEEEASS